MNVQWEDTRGRVLSESAQAKPNLACARLVVDVEPARGTLIG